jgi:UDP-N-acetylmuramyl pentapeptide phosphotransferase/UDP-N-acetylglucosamine-1-phosphate transferase
LTLFGHPTARAVAVRHGAMAVAAGVLAAGAARLAYAALRRRPPGGEKTWTRTNHRGEPVTLTEGPAVTAGALAALALTSAFPKQALAERHTPLFNRGGLGGLSPRGGSPTRPATIPLVIAGTGAAAFGVYDDLAGSGKRRGLRGHLGALLHGEVTTGAVKLLGLGATGLVSAAMQYCRGGIDPPQAPPAHGGASRPPVPPAPPAGGLSAPHPVDMVINAGLIAGGANLLNLFDLRPGRAIKVAAASGVLLAATDAGDARRSDYPFRKTIVLAPPLGAALALLPDDLRERAMLGDGGANALGALLGAAAAATLPRPARAGLLAGITALTLASEKISFTKVIERTPPLRWLDMLGRRPPRPRA